MGWCRGQAYSQDLRDRVLRAQGAAPAVAARFGVSASYVQRARARRAQHGELSAGAQRNHVPLRLAGLEQALKDEVAAHPDATLAQLCAWAKAEHGVAVGLATMSKSLRRFGLTLKKSPSTPPSRPVPMSPKHARRGSAHSPHWPGGA
jgi:transposase